MSRIHNTMLIRGMSVIIAFSIFFHILALTDQLSLIEVISIVGVPIVFLGFIQFTNQRGTMWLLVPLTLYLFDRFFVYMWKGIDGLNDGLSPLYTNDTLSVFFQLNSVRLILSLVFVVLLISAITSRQKAWFYKTHYFAVVLLIMQIIEVGLWVFTDMYELSPSIIAQLLIVPGLLYFPLMMIFITRLHIYEVFVEQGVSLNPGEINRPTLHQAPPPSPVEAPPHQPEKPAAKPHPETPFKPSNQPPPKKPNPTPKPQPSFQPKSITCPLCGTKNSNTHICKTCGQSLK